LPTEAGLRLFVDGLLEVGNLTDDERNNLKQQCAGFGTSVEGLMEKATTALSGLSGCASLVMAPKTDKPLRHIELVNLSHGRALVVLVSETGVVENRIIDTPPGTQPSALVEASNFLSARLVGRTVSEARQEILAELEAHEAKLDELTSRVVASGLASWAGGDKGGSLIVRGQANLLEDVQAIGDLEHIRSLFAALDVATGKVIGKCYRRHRAKEFLAFLRQIDRATPAETDLHLILDNSSTHTTDAIRDWLENHPRFHLHFTPTSASWLNAVETWFAQLERRSIHRGVFTSVVELRDEIHRYIEVHNRKLAKPFQWTKSAEAIIDKHRQLKARITGRD